MGRYVNRCTAATCTFVLAATVLGAGCSSTTIRASATTSPTSTTVTAPQPTSSTDAATAPTRAPTSSPATSFGGTTASAQPAAASPSIRQVWQIKQQDVGAVIVHGGTVFMLTSLNTVKTLTAMAAATGVVKWTVDVTKVDSPIVMVASSGVYVADENLSNFATVRAYDSATGQLRWASTPDVTLAGATQDAIVTSEALLDTATGVVRRTMPQATHAEAVVGETIIARHFASDGSETLVGLDAADLTERWKTAADELASAPEYISRDLVVYGRPGTTNTPDPATLAGGTAISVASGTASKVTLDYSLGNGRPDLQRRYCSDLGYQMSTAEPDCDGSLMLARIVGLADANSGSVVSKYASNEVVAGLAGGYLWVGIADGSLQARSPRDGKVLASVAHVTTPRFEAELTALAADSTSLVMVLDGATSTVTGFVLAN